MKVFTSLKPIETNLTVITAHSTLLEMPIKVRLQGTTIHLNHFVTLGSVWVFF